MALSLATDLQAAIETELDRWDVPGMALGIFAEGESEVLAFGSASDETRAPVRPDTIFQIGSITKVFTATLVMQLVEEGLVDLDTPVVRYLPELRLGDMKALHAITPRMLLGHVGGFFGDLFTDTGMGDDALARFVAGFGTLAQITPPGTLFSYCNTGFAIAGLLIERLRGVPFEQVTRERLFEPLGMERTFLFPHEAITYPLAIGHNTLPDQERQIARRYPLPRASNPAGGILSTAGDLLRFARAHLNDGELDGQRILSPESARLMRVPQYPAGSFADAYGVGWMLRTIDGATVAGHGGSTNGFRAQLSLVPERGVAVAMLTNGSRGNAVNHAIERLVLTRYAGLVFAEPPRVALAPERLARLAGHYERPLNRVDIAVADGALTIAQEAESPLNGQRVVFPPVRAEAIAPDRFLIVEGESAGETIEFIDGPNGEVRFMRLHGRLTDRVA